MIGESFNDFINVSSPIKIGSNYKSRPSSNSPKNKKEAHDDDDIKKESVKKNAKLNRDLINKAMRNQP